MEAPGIEPGSERLPVTGPTRVSRSEYVNGNLRACNRSRPRPYVSIRSRRLASRPDPAGADVRSRYPALTGGRAALRPREPSARSRFCLVGFLRGQLTNHGAHQTPSVLRRNQFAPKCANRRSFPKTATARVKRWPHHSTGAGARRAALVSGVRPRKHATRSRGFTRGHLAGQPQPSGRALLGEHAASPRA